jgi:voltage-gated potassium channel
MKGLRERKYLVLLAALVVAAIVEPLVRDWSERTQILVEVMLAVVNLGVFLVVFERRWERYLAFFLVFPLFATSVAHSGSVERLQVVEIIFHAFGIAFLGFGAALILKRVFQQKTIRIDAVIGALCGYLLVAGAWANAYALIYQLRPGSFRVADVIAGQLEYWPLQRLLFNYLSVMTLTTLGYNDITPIGPLALTLSWLEVVFGQFYIAVVVAQLVGLRLAQSLTPKSS